MSLTIPRAARAGLIALAIVPLALAACRVEAPYERTNPVDPGADFEFALAGPDSTHTADAVVQLQFLSDPPIDPQQYSFAWYAEDWIDMPEPVPDNYDPRAAPRYPAMVSQGDGQFSAVNATAEYKTVVLRAQLHETALGHQILVGQKAVAIELSCAPFTQPVVHCDTPPRAADQTVPIYVRLWDASGSPVRDIRWAIQRGSLVSRNAAVATTFPVTLDTNGIVRVRTQFGGGSTYVVVRMDEAVDSIRVTVVP